MSTVILLSFLKLTAEIQLYLNLQKKKKNCTLFNTPKMVFSYGTLNQLKTFRVPISSVDLHIHIALGNTILYLPPMDNRSI
jgi:hypothetical protein